MAFFFVLFCFVFISDESVTSVLAKNAGKAVIHRKKINCLVTTLYEVFNRLQAFLFSFCGNQSGNRKKAHFALLGSRSEQLQGNVLNFPFAIILQKILF